MTARLPLNKLLKISLIGSLALLTSSVVLAQEDPVTQSSIGIEVSAPTYNFNIDPGGVSQEIIRVKNVSTNAQTFYPEVLDFRAVDESGTPSFITPEQSETYTYSLASWITISQEPINIAPDESVALSFTINVPPNAEPGGRYAGILFGTQPPETAPGQVSIANKVGSLILVRVSGEADQAALVKEFSTSKTSYNQGPVDFIVRVENNGNVHVVPRGVIEIKNLLGSTVASLNVNSNNGNVLPESIRRFDSENGLLWPAEGFQIGKYTASLSLTYGDPTQTLNGEITFWIMPWNQIALFALVIIIALVVLIFAIKSYNKLIISRALKSQQNPPSSNS